MYDLVIKDTTLVTLNPSREILKKHSIAVKDNKIEKIAPSSEINDDQAQKIINGKGKCVFPGLINTHNHLFQTLLKGLGDDNVLSDWLVKAMFPSAAKLDQEGAYYGALLGCLDGLHSGTTTMVDYMHANPKSGISDGVVKAYKKLGIRGVLGRGYMDNGFKYGTPEALSENTKDIENDCQRLLEQYHGNENDRIRVWIAPAAVWLSTAKSLKMSQKLAEEYNTKLTIHVSETPFDRQASEDLHGKPDIDVLEELDLLSPEMLMVHCVHLTERDMRMAKYFNTGISHNPVSNMYLSSGVAPIPRMIETGINVGLATDGAASNNTNNMLEVLKITSLLHKVNKLDPTVITAEKVLEMATIDGARALGMEDEIGSLEEGKKADLFIFNPQNSAQSIPLHNPVSTLVYSSDSSNIETVIIDGDIVLDSGLIKNIKESDVLIKAQKIADELSVKAETNHLKDRKWRSIAY